MILNHVVGFGPEAEERRPDDVDHVLGRLQVRILRLESGPVFKGQKKHGIESRSRALSLSLSLIFA